MSDGDFPAIDANALGELCGVNIDRATINYLLGSVKWLASEDRYFGSDSDIYETTQAFEQFARRLMQLTTESECVEFVMIPPGTVMAYAGSSEGDPPSGWLFCDGVTLYSQSEYPALYAALDPVYHDGNQFRTPALMGRAIVGAGAIDGGTERAVGDFGGTETHTLITAEMPSHTHVQDSHNHIQDSHNHSQNSHNHTQDSHNHSQNSHNHTQDAHGHGSHTHTIPVANAASGFGNGGITLGNIVSNNQILSGSTAPTSVTATNQAATATNNATTATNQPATATNNATTATNQPATATNQNTGGGQGHNNMPPFHVLNYIIKT